MENKIPKINETLLRKYINGQIKDIEIIKLIKFSLEVNSHIRSLYNTLLLMEDFEKNYPENPIEVTQSNATMRFLNEINSSGLKINEDKVCEIITLIEPNEKGLAAGDEGKDYYIFEDENVNFHKYKWSLKKVNDKQKDIKYQIILYSDSEDFKRNRYYIIKNGDKVLKKIEGYSPKTIMDDIDNEIDFKEGLKLVIEEI